MSVLIRTLRTLDASATAELLWRRLCGEALDVPFDRSRGESPHHALVELFVAQGTAPGARHTLLTALNQLLEGKALPAIERLKSGDAVEVLPPLYELFRLIEEVKPEQAETFLFPAGLAILDLMERSEIELAIAADFFRAAGHYLDRDAKLRILCSAALASPIGHTEIAAALAITAPREFLHTLLPDFLWAQRNRSPLEGVQYVMLRECIRAAVSTLADRSGWADSNSAIDSLRRPVAALSNFSSGPSVHRAVLEGLALANVSAETIRQFDDEYWELHPKRERG
jgi:hypothetical protein